MNTFLLELCAESLNTALAAERGGADRIELCDQLKIGGVTPGERLTATVVHALSIPVHVLIRPRGGAFFYTTGEFDQMREQVKWAKKAGAGGVVLGVLRADGCIDVDRSQELVELARPMKVTFHRAFDATPDLGEALEAVIETGADCLLTSAGAPNVLSGVEELGRLVRQARGRIQIMAGGGLKLASMLEVLERTGVRCLHGSLARRDGENGNGSRAAIEAENLEADVRTAVHLLRGHFAAQMI
ncbi:MAG: copper homeostasis protein CutC [Terracidiphilus sp.]|jgi:copper homeostasis protein